MPGPSYELLHLPPYNILLFCVLSTTSSSAETVFFCRVTFLGPTFIDALLPALVC